MTLDPSGLPCGGAERTAVDVATIGETMAVFVGRAGSDEYVAVPGGAESNVAVGLAALGLRARWVSRLGDDHLGRRIADTIADRGVDVAVEVDPDRPTGSMVKVLTGSTAERRYYRSQSAARELSPSDLDRVGPARWLHLTGITPALSTSAASLVRAALSGTTADRPRVSFDVNLRPSLWPDDATAATTLRELAALADLVFVGDDEAETLYGTADVTVVAREVLQRDEQALVLKRGPGPATLVSADGTVEVPADSVDVVDVVGAGDAFASGVLGAICLGRHPVDCLRVGHALAARVVATTRDMVDPLSDAERVNLGLA